MINESSNNVHYIEVEHNEKRYIMGDIINSLYRTTFKQKRNSKHYTQNIPILIHLTQIN